MKVLVKKAKEELSQEWNYEIQHSKKEKSFVDSYELKVSSVKVEKELNFNNIESIVNALQEHLEKIQRSKDAAQEKLTEICNGRIRGKSERLEKRINGKLEEVFNAEDARIQSVVKMVKENINNEDSEEVKELTRKAKLTLLKNQKYSLWNPSEWARKRPCDDFDLKVEKGASLESVGFEERKPTNMTPSFTEKGDLSLSFTFFNEDEVDVLKDAGSTFEVEVKMWEKGHEEDDTSKTLTKTFIPGNKEPICFKTLFAASTTYCLKMRIDHQGISTQWSDEAEFTTSDFKECCVWEECPDNVDKDRKYSVDEENPRIATKICGGYRYCTIIGNTSLPPNQVTSWSIKILKSRWNNGYCIYIGVAPSDINQNYYNSDNRYGWYFDCYESRLWSGPPHNYKWKEYGPRKGDWGDYVHTGDNVGVVMDTAKGELSFVLDGVNLGVAYEGIPLDKPLVPCVLLKHCGDSVELDTSEVKESVDSSIPVPSNITTKNITWDSITLTWDTVEGTSFYQIEVDGSKFLEKSMLNEFTKRGLLPNTEHSSRVRVMKENSVSEWSDVVKGRTQKAPSFSKCAWKECPDDVNKHRKYSVDEKNSRIATNIKPGYPSDDDDDDYDDDGSLCTIIGNTLLPPNQVTSWSIKIQKSRENNVFGIYIGVAPSDINQNDNDNFEKCGWYFDCFESTLCSGPPHDYGNKEYGPRKKKEYVHTGDSVGIVMDTAKGELSFVLNGVNLGVAYEGIPLDKPLVPCVLLGNNGDSVELVI